MIKDQRDFWAGLMFMAFGGFFCLYSVYNYNIGTAFRMGPGYFPMLLGGFLFFLGFLITAKSVLFKSSEEDGGKFGKFDWYNFFVILGSVTIFAVLLRPAGLIPATAVMVFLSSFGNRPFRWIRTLLLCVFLSVAVWLIFVLGLDLTVPIWPAFSRIKGLNYGFTK